MRVPTGERCDVCRFCAHGSQPVAAKVNNFVADVLLCVRNPPLGNFPPPIVRAEGWCGEFRREATA